MSLEIIIVFMAKKQFLGIRFPFRNDDQENFFLDLSKTDKDKTRSDICHVIFTQKGTRYKMWDYGTDLIKFIFEQSDDESWEGIKDEIKGAVARWVPSCVLNDIRVVQDEQNNGAVYVRIDYSVKKGYISTDDSFMVTL